MRKLLLAAAMLALLATGGFLFYPKTQSPRDAARTELAKLQTLSHKSCLCRLVGGEERSCERDYLEAAKTLKLEEFGDTSMPTSAIYACLPEGLDGQSPQQNDCIERSYQIVVENATSAFVCTRAQNDALNTVWNRVYRQTGSDSEAAKALLAAFEPMKRKEIEKLAKPTTPNAK